MRTVTKVKHVGSVWVVPTQLAPALGDDDPDTCLRSSLENKVGHSLWIVNDNASEANVQRCVA